MTFMKRQILMQINLVKNECRNEDSNRTNIFPQTVFLLNSFLPCNFVTSFIGWLNWFWAKGRRFSEKDWYYLQAQTDMPFHYLKLVVWIFPPFFQVPHCKHTGSADSQLLRRTVVWNVISKFKFNIVIWHIFLSPVKFSEKKGPLYTLCAKPLVRLSYP